MSALAQNLSVEKYRQLKARALMLALASQCRTPLDAVRFLFVQFETTELRQLQRVAEAALRARVNRV
jgi:hypothetical protein